MNEDTHELWLRAVRSVFSWLVRLHRTGDYSRRMYVSVDEAHEAVDNTCRILQAVRIESPEPLPPIEDEL